MQREVKRFRTTPNDNKRGGSRTAATSKIERFVIIVKVGLSPSKKIYFYLFQWKPVKNDENAYFILKALFVLEIFKFLSWLFGRVEKNGLIRETRLISKFMTSQPG